MPTTSIQRPTCERDGCDAEAHVVHDELAYAVGHFRWSCDEGHDGARILGATDADLRP